MNPILMALAADNARKLAEMSLEGRPFTLSVPSLHTDAIFSGIRSWLASIRSGRPQAV